MTAVGRLHTRPGLCGRSHVHHLLHVGAIKALARPLCGEKPRRAVLAPAWEFVGGCVVLPQMFWGKTIPNVGTLYPYTDCWRVSTLPLTGTHRVSLNSDT